MTVCIFSPNSGKVLSQMHLGCGFIWSLAHKPSGEGLAAFQQLRHLAVLPARANRREVSSEGELAESSNSARSSRRAHEKSTRRTWASLATRIGRGQGSGEMRTYSLKQHHSQISPRVPPTADDGDGRLLQRSVFRRDMDFLRGSDSHLKG